MSRPKHNPTVNRNGIRILPSRRTKIQQFEATTSKTVKEKQQHDRSNQ